MCEMLLLGWPSQPSDQRWTCLSRKVMRGQDSTTPSLPLPVYGRSSVLKPEYDVVVLHTAVSCEIPCVTLH